MKIHEIANLKLIVEGGVVEPNALMSVQNIVKNGKATNTFEFIVVARLLQLLKNGNFYKNSNPLFDDHITTSKELMDMLRALPADQMTSLASKLLELLAIKDADAYYYLINPAQEYAIWLRSFYHAREADD